jgi:dephospho-CoA kinase
MIIGISGYKRSGKNTVAQIISDKFGYETLAFADPIKQIASLMFSWSFERMENEKETIDKDWGLSPRQAFQIIGNELAQYWLPEALLTFKQTTGRLLWVRHLFNKIKYKKDICVSDVRYPHEADAIQMRGGKIVKVVRDSVIPNDSHESESYCQDIYPDYIIYNNGTLAELEQEVEMCFYSLLEIGQ